MRAISIRGPLAGKLPDKVSVFPGCLHPPTGAWVVFTTFDRPIPAWAVIAYGLFFGAVPLLVYALMRGAANPRTRLLQSVAVISTANLLIEIPSLSGDVYVHYGDQPVKAFGRHPKEQQHRPVPGVRWEVADPGVAEPQFRLAWVRA